MSVEATLNERGKTHGDFKEGARVQVGILRAMGILPPTSHFSDSQIAVWLNVAGKQSRAVVGNPNFIDNYRDAAGYPELEVKILEKTPGAIDVVQEYTKVELNYEDKI